MKYKRTVIAVTTLATLTTASTVLAATHDNPPLPTKAIQATKEELTQPITEETTPVQEQTPTVVATPDGKPVVQQTVPVVQPDYGEDPSNPGTFIVFNKQAVMTAAGIATSDISLVETTFNYTNPNWIYKKVNGIPYFFNLCAEPRAEKMAIFGTDYETNPVTQLKWCDNMVKAKWGSWQAAHDHAMISGSVI